MPGELDEQYIRARAALLDAAEALAPHLDSIVLVGAQAIYLHTGAADLVVAEFTTDADFSVEPALLGNEPLLAELLEARGFTRREHPGGWRTPAACTSTSWCPRRSTDAALEAPTSVHMNASWHDARSGWKAPELIANSSPSGRSPRPTIAA